MDDTMKELIAMGASAAVNCHPCMEYHLAKCDALGVDRQQVRQAVEVGLMVNKGAGEKTRAKSEALLGVSKKEHSGGCCGA